MRIAKLFVWLGFIALLAISIPKVAWVVRSYEGSTPILVTQIGVTIDILWLIPLFVAICIDVLIMALTYAVSNDKSRASQVSMWCFVGLLCGLSCYCNLLYNYAHSPYGSVWADSFVSNVTPYIIAGVPLFALCYTLILSRLNGAGETLADKVTRLEAEKALKTRLGEATKGRFTGRLKDAISSVADLKNHTQQTFRASLNGHSTNTSADIDQTLNGHSADIPGDTLEIQNGHSADMSSDIARILEEATTGHTDDIKQTTGEIQVGLVNGQRDSMSNRSTRAIYITIKEAAKTYGYAETYLIKLAQRGTIRTKHNDRSRLLVSSLEAYIARAGRHKQDTTTPALTIVS